MTLIGKENVIAVAVWRNVKMAEINATVEWETRLCKVGDEMSDMLRERNKK